MTEQRRALWPAHSLAVFSAVAVLASGSPAVAAADQPEYVAVKLKTSFLDVDPERIKRVQPVMERRAAEVLEFRHGIEVGTDAEVTVTLHVLDLEDRVDPKRIVVDYGVRIEVRTDAEKLGDEIVQCMQMGEAELVDCAVSGIETVLQFVPRVESVPTDSHDPPKVPPPDPVANTNMTSERIAPVGPVGIVGIVVGVGAIVTGIAGAIDLGRGEVVGDDVGGGSHATDYRPRGRPLVGVGAGLLVAGAVLFGVDFGIRAKRRKQAASKAVSIGIGPGFTGLTVHGRF